MAQLNASPASSTTVSWSIGGLSSPWNAANYLEAILSSSPAQNDTPNRPANVLSSMSPPPTGINFNTPSQIAGGGAFSGGATYTLYGTMRAANGNYYNAGSAIVTMPSDRPTNFVWQHSNILQGSEAVISAIDWNTLASKVNLFRQYKGLPSYGFTPAPYADGRIYAFMYVQMIIAIGEMNPPLPVPQNRSSGDFIYASDINRLKDALNSIP